MDTMKGMFKGPDKVPQSSREGVDYNQKTTPEKYNVDVLGPNADAEVAANRARIEANEREVNAAIEVGDQAKAAELIAALQAGTYESAAASPEKNSDEEVA